jgi:hypothetical protein
MLTINHEVDLDCAVGYKCRGDVNVNEDGWLDFEFGNVHGSELQLVRMDKVYAATAATKLIDPPADLDAWLKAKVGSAAVKTSAVTVGGKAATAFDVKATVGVRLSPIPANTIVLEYGRDALRLIVLRVDGHAVLLSEWLGPENTIRDGAAALSNLQPLIESIVWS